MASSLGELEQELRSISHSEEAIQAVQAFSNGLAGTKGRLDVWNAVNAIVHKPIDCGETVALGFDTPDDRFTVLQGDIVQTEAAYFYGERIAGMPKFAVLNSSCDLVPGRTAHASLLRILPIRKNEETSQGKAGHAAEVQPARLYVSTRPAGRRGGRCGQCDLLRGHLSDSVFRFVSRSSARFFVCPWLAGESLRPSRGRSWHAQTLAR